MVQFKGVDKQGEDIFDERLPLPTLNFEGTVKLHGTNAGVSINSREGMYFQSRNRIISPIDDNQGFAQFALDREEIMLEMLADVSAAYEVDLAENTLTLFFEFFGGNIQGGVALTGLPKMAAVLGAKVTPNDEEVRPYHIKYLTLESPKDDIYNVNSFPRYSVTIDFDAAEAGLKIVDDLVSEVEAECPAGQFFGRKLGEDCTVGEGIVWTGSYLGRSLVFKAKGEAHSNVSKIRTKKEPEQFSEHIGDFIDYSVTDSRLLQGIERVFTENNRPVTIQATGDFIKWVVMDIIAEEQDTLMASKIPQRQVGKSAAGRIRKWFMHYLDVKAML